LKAKDVMTANVITLDPDDTVDHAISLMVDHKISGLPVVDGTGDLVGVVSEFDLLELICDCRAEKDRIRDYMSTDIQKVEVEADWVEVADTLRSSHLRRVPVTHNDKLVGIISRHDMMCSIQRDRRPTEPARPEVATADVKLSCRALVVDDGRANAQFLSLVLKRAGAEASIANNGQAAVEKVRATMTQTEGVGEERPFDVILMDIQMPVMDGYEATKLLREEGYRGRIIAVSAGSEGHDHQKCLDVGCDDYIPKPIDRDTLLRAIAGNGSSSS